jgi:oligosaccharide repeat unit polymerase
MQINLNKILINPLVIFLGIWVATFYLYTLNISGIIIAPPDDFYLYIYFVVIGASVGYVIGYYLIYKLKGKSKLFDNKSKRIEKIINRMFFIIFSIYVITVFYSGGIPILYYLISVGPLYNEFGIPTIHGFFNSLVIFTGTLTFWVLMDFSKRLVYRFIFFMCLLIPIVGIHRASLLILIAQTAFIYIAIRINKINLRFILIILLIVITAIIFGVIGNLRSGSIEERSSIQEGYEWLPFWAVWFYMYLVSPLSNFAQITSQTIAYSYGSVSLSGLTPSVIRSHIWGDSPAILTDIGEQTFNIASYAAAPYVDGGWIGLILFTAFLMMIAAYCYRIFLERHSLYDLLRLTILSQIILMTVFSNFFFNITIIFQLIICLIFRTHLIRIDAYIKLVK